MVLKYITAAKVAGFGVVFITLEHLTQEMADGDELEALSHELRGKSA